VLAFRVVLKVVHFVGGAGLGFGGVEGGHLAFSLAAVSVASFDFAGPVFHYGETVASRVIGFDMPRHLVLGNREYADVFGLAGGAYAIEALAGSEEALDRGSVFCDWEAVNGCDG
jgi:hypothetical protein